MIRCSGRRESRADLAVAEDARRQRDKQVEQVARAAGVQHETGVGDGRRRFLGRGDAGCDLVGEKLAEAFVGDAFSPVGLMLDLWDETLPAGSEQPFSVYVLNDLDEAWDGEVRLLVLREDEIVSEETRTVRVDPLGREIITIEGRMPDAPGAYTVAAELVNTDGNEIRSLRDVEVVR